MGHPILVQQQAVRNLGRIRFCGFPPLRREKSQGWGTQTLFEIQEFPGLSAAAEETCGTQLLRDSVGAAENLFNFFWTYLGPSA